MKPRAAPGHLGLVAATVLATLAVQRHVWRLAQDPPADHALSAGIGAARSPSRSAWRLSWSEWRGALVRTYNQINDDRLLATAAGVVFYGLLAIFPAVTALVSSYGLFADPSTIAGHLQNLAMMLPDGTFAVVQDQIGRVLDKGGATLGATFIFGLLLAVWSANAGMKAIIDALNVVYEEREKRGFFTLNLISLAFTIAALAGILLMIGTVIAVPLALQRVGLGERAEWIVWLGRWPVMVLLLLTALAVLFRFAPSHSHPRWQWITPGALAASLLWLAGSAALSWYLSNFGNYTATYGSLGAAIGLMMWMWLSTIVVLLGAQLDIVIERKLPPYSE
jgi:membrane protein